MGMYHIAKIELNEGDVLKTHVPPYLIKEEGDIPRTCVSDNPIKCMLAIHPVVNKCKVYNKTYTALYTWLYDTYHYEKNITIEKMKDAFNVFETKFPESTVRLMYDASGVNHIIFRYKSISISEIKSLIRMFNPYCWSIEFIREDDEEIYFRFYLIKNVQLLKVMEKSYLPPNASDFRKFGERWVLHDTNDYKILGRIDMVSLFRNHIFRFTDKKYTVIHDFPERKLCVNSKVKFEI